MVAPIFSISPQRRRSPSGVLQSTEEPAVLSPKSTGCGRTQAANRPVPSRHPETFSTARRGAGDVGADDNSSARGRALG